MKIDKVVDRYLTEKVEIPKGKQYFADKSLMGDRIVHVFHIYDDRWYGFYGVNTYDAKSLSTLLYKGNLRGYDIPMSTGFLSNSGRVLKNKDIDVIYVWSPDDYVDNNDGHFGYEMFKHLNIYDNYEDLKRDIKKSKDVNVPNPPKP